MGVCTSDRRENPEANIEEFVCFVCKKSGGKIYRCARCKNVRYCSVDCQTKDWPTHKDMCKSESPLKTPEKSDVKGYPVSPSTSPSKSDIKGYDPSGRQQTERVVTVIVGITECKDLHFEKEDAKKIVLLVDIDGRQAKTQKKGFSKKMDWKETFTFNFHHAPHECRIKILTEEQHDKLYLLKEADDDNEGEATRTLELTFDTKVSLRGKIDMGEALHEKKSIFNDWLQLEGVKGHVKASIAYQISQQPVGRTGGLDEEITKVPRDQLRALLSINVLSGVKLHSKDWLSLSDAYCVVSIGKHLFRSKTKLNSRNPQWNFRCPIWLTNEDWGDSKSTKRMITRITVYDADLTSQDDAIGSIFFDAKTLVEGKTYKSSLSLRAGDVSTDAQLSELEAKGNFLVDLSKGDEKLPAKGPGGIKLEVSLTSYSQVETNFYEKLMEEYDIDKNGSLTFPEIFHLCSIIGSKKTEPEIRQVFNEFDTDKNGSIDRKELLAMFKSGKFHDEEIDRVLRLVMPVRDAHESLIMRGIFDHTFTHTSVLDKQPDNSGAKILVQDRRSGLVVQENIPAYVKAAMRLVYRTSGGRSALETSGIQKVLKMGTITAGRKMDNPASKNEIPGFIDLHKLNVDEFEWPVSKYNTMNEFFYRRLKTGARICAEVDNHSVAVSPADCRTMVFQTIEDSKKLWIKGQNFTVENLLGAWGKEKDRAAQFKGGSLLISRLAPQDYHRWHFPVTGVVQPRSPINGEYMTVNPIAIRRDVDVFTLNKRCVCPIETKEFGLVVLVAIAATMVGSINFECTCTDLKSGERSCSEGKCYSGKQVKKFDPHGYFAFGGSTCIVLFRPGRIKFDSDLLDNSGKQLETLIRVGERVGVAT